MAHWYINVELVWPRGARETVDEAEDYKEARRLVTEYKTTYKEEALRVWMSLRPVTTDKRL